MTCCTAYFVDDFSSFFGIAVMFVDVKDDVFDGCFFDFLSYFDFWFWSLV